MRSLISGFLPLFLSLGLSIPTFAAAPTPIKSSFREVWSVVEGVGFTPRTDIERSESAVYSMKFPVYPVNQKSVFGEDSNQLTRDGQRTINEHKDYYDRISKKVHANGICVSGSWSITNSSSYTGLFKKGSQALFIGRISTTMDSVLRSENRGFGFAGKLFPTLSIDAKVDTANFFSVDVLLGTKIAHVLDAATTNEPEIGISVSTLGNLGRLGLGLKIADSLKKANPNPAFRPLYPLSQSGESGTFKTPHWIRLRASAALKRNEERDFRAEILQAMKDNQVLVYKIDVSDSTKNRQAQTGWQELGEIVLQRAVVSYGCDRRLHFPHPPL